MVWLRQVGSLVLHYNKRMTGVRKQAESIVSWLTQKGIDYDSILGRSTKDAYASGENYDRQELRLFSWILGASPVLVLLSLIFLRELPH